jgi:hypothetical protein
MTKKGVSVPYKCKTYNILIMMTKMYRLPAHMQVPNLWIWITHGNLLVQIQVLIFEIEISAGQIQINPWVNLLMSMPDALPTEIALIALILFKFQVYLTSFHHYYNRLITPPPHCDYFTSQLYTTWHQSMPCNYLKKFFCLQDWCLTHTVQPHTASAIRSSIVATSLDFYQFSQAYFYLNRTSQKSWDPLMAILWPSLIFKFNYGTALGEIAATFITSSTLDSINQTSSAAMATHAIRHCYTSSTQNTCDWCDLIIFLV